MKKNQYTFFEKLAFIWYSFLFFFFFFFFAFPICVYSKKYLIGRDLNYGRIVNCNYKIEDNPRAKKEIWRNNFLYPHSTKYISYVILFNKLISLYLKELQIK